MTHHRSTAPVRSLAPRRCRLTNRKIAHALGLSVATAKIRINRRARLRRAGGRRLARRRGWRPEVHQALDLCLSCKPCSAECPTGVDMAAYQAEVLHHTYRRRLRPRSHYALGRLPGGAAGLPRTAPGQHRAHRTGAGPLRTLGRRRFLLVVAYLALVETTKRALFTAADLQRPAPARAQAARQRRAHCRAARLTTR